MNINSHYLVIFNNPRDRSQLVHLARQMYPNNMNFLIECYDDAASNKPYGNLFLDLKQETDKNYRVRAGIFKNEQDKIVYIPI